MCAAEELPYWLRFLSTVALLLLPLIGAYIAWKQMRMQDIGLKHQLYDRRFKIYDATRDFLKIVLTKAAVENSDFATFAIATADASFVFDAKIKDFLKEIREHGAALLVFGPLVAQNIDFGRIGPEHADYVNRKTNALLSLNSVFEQLEAKFLPYMQLEQPWKIRFLQVPRF